jgi:hypothetical protein
MFVTDKYIKQTQSLARGVKRYVYTSLTIAGKAAMRAWNAPLSGLATVQAALDERFVRVQPISATYNVSHDEILQGDLIDRDPLNTRATLAIQSVFTKVDEVGFVGEPNYPGIYGITNQPAANLVAVLADGVAASTLFSSKTAPQIVRDLNKMAYATPSGTDGTYTSKVIMLPTLAYLAAAQALDSNSDNESALTIFLKNIRQYIPDFQVIQAPYLDTLGPGGTSVAITLDPSPEIIEFVKVPGIFVDKMRESIDGYTGTINAYAGGMALKQSIPFNYTVGV